MNDVTSSFVNGNFLFVQNVENLGIQIHSNVWIFSFYLFDKSLENSNSNAELFLQPQVILFHSSSCDRQINRLLDSASVQADKEALKNSFNVFIRNAILTVVIPFELSEKLDELGFVLLTLGLALIGFRPPGGSVPNEGISSDIKTADLCEVDTFQN